MNLLQAASSGIDTFNEIRDVLIRMSELLQSSGLRDWARMLTQIAERSDEGYPAIRPEIRRMYGGMGSLNDIVLHRDGKVLKYENNEFDALRERLYALTRD
ncbi:DUF6966 domain-containing protein [Paraburkholderia ribeironis]|nr:hypothetical protein [Paraburkholderia ribeironis]